MSSTFRGVAFGVLPVIAVCAAPGSAAAQTPASVRVVKTARIQRWLGTPSSDVLLVAEPGTTLAVLDKQGDWLWVVVPPDVHGTRKAGWVRGGSVEPVVARAAVESTRPDDAASMASGTSAADAAQTPNPAEDKVTITGTRNEAGSTKANASAATPAYTFEEIHFDLNRYALRDEDADNLRAAAAALKADPSLVVTIEGHTCSLGAASYNMTLGQRRADAVKAYLVGEGIAPERLHTVSMGEQQPKYDNSREATRKLNRRVAVVPRQPER